MRSAYRLPITLSRLKVRCVHTGIVRSAVTLRVWLSVIISLAFLLPELFLVKQNGQIYEPYFTHAAQVIRVFSSIPVTLRAADATYF